MNTIKDAQFGDIIDYQRLRAATPDFIAPRQLDKSTEFFNNQGG